MRRLWCNEAAEGGYLLRLMEKGFNIRLWVLFKIKLGIEIRITEEKDYC